MIRQLECIKTRIYITCNFIASLTCDHNLVFWGPRSFQFELEMNFNIYCMHYILLEKITGGPSGPLAIILFFQKSGQQTHTHTNKHTG